MSEWTRVCHLTELPVGERWLLELDGVHVVVFHLEDGLHAIENVCTHDGGELASGELRGGEIVCPRHGARFDVRTGAVTAPPAWEPVATLPVRLADGWVEVRDNRWN